MEGMAKRQEIQYVGISPCTRRQVRPGKKCPGPGADAHISNEIRLLYRRKSSFLPMSLRLRDKKKFSFTVELPKISSNGSSGQAAIEQTD
jgi:hypothetical protein